ncbi:hypothetical protein NN561_020206 [Cricetulus griseus]
MQRRCYPLREREDARLGVPDRCGVSGWRSGGAVPSGEGRCPCYDLTPPPFIWRALLKPEAELAPPSQQSERKAGRGRKGARWGWRERRAERGGGIGVASGDPGRGGGAESRCGRGASTAAPLAFLLQVAQNFAPWLLAACVPYSRLAQPLEEAKADGDSWASAGLSPCSKEAGTPSSC